MKSYSFIFQILLLIAAISCSKEVSPIIDEESPVNAEFIQMNAEVSLDSDEAETRTSVGNLSNGEYKVSWSNTGEVLRVIQDIDGSLGDYESTGYSLKNSNRTAVFTFSLPVDKKGKDYKYYAFYPSSAFKGKSVANKYVYLNLPSTQTSTANSADASASLLFGSMSGFTQQPISLGFSLSHLVAYWKVSISNLPLQRWETVQSVKISIPGKDLAGGADYYFVTGELTAVSNSTKSAITVNQSSTSGTFDLYLASWPVTLTSGDSMTVTVTTSGNTYSRTISLTKTMAFQKGKMSKLKVNMASAKSPNSYYENDVYLGEGVDIDGTVWAPVNCGYNATNYPYGRMFQWGRPFGSGYSTDYDARAFTPVHSTTSHTEAAKEENAFKFYYTGVSPYDWLATADDTMWNTGTETEPKRTKYTPCPAGWRVPTLAETTALRAHTSAWTTNNGLKGKWFSGSKTYGTNVPAIFLPAAGWISYADAKAGGRTSYGRYWTSSTQTYSLRFDQNGSNMHTAERSSSFSVRCVKVN